LRPKRSPVPTKGLGLLAAALLLGSTPLIAGCGRAQESAPAAETLPQERLLQRLADSVSAERMMETVRFLASPEMRGRPAGSPQNEEVASFLESSFREAGLQPLEALGLGGLRQNFEFPASRSFLDDPPGEAVSASNIIGVIPGSARPSELVVFAANFDGMGVDPETGEVYPGADYNATGAAAVLELARVMASLGEAPQSTLVFAELNAGECGHFGAKALAEALEERGLRGSARIICLEGLGAGSGEYMDVWDFNYRKNRQAVRALDEAASFLDVYLEINGSEPGSASALFFMYHMPSVTCDWSWYDRSEHPDFHLSSDTPERVREEGMLKVARVAGVAGWLLSLQSP